MSKDTTKSMDNTNNTVIHEDTDMADSNMDGERLQDGTNAVHDLSDTVEETSDMDDAANAELEPTADDAVSSTSTSDDATADDASQPTVNFSVVFDDDDPSDFGAFAYMGDDDDVDDDVANDIDDSIDSATEGSIASDGDNIAENGIDDQTSSADSETHHADAKSTIATHIDPRDDDNDGTGERSIGDNATAGNGTGTIDYSIGSTGNDTASTDDSDTSANDAHDTAAPQLSDEEHDITASNAEHVRATLNLAKSESSDPFAGHVDDTKHNDDSTRVSSRIDREINNRHEDDILLKSYPTFALDHVTVINHKSGRKVLDDAQLSFYSGRFYGISIFDDDELRQILLSTMGGFLHPDSGQVMLKSANLAELEGSDIRGHRIGVVPQQFALREDLDAVSNIVYAMDASGRTFLKPKAVLAREILQHVGFEGVSTGIAVRKLTTVEQRRIAIARAICCEAVAIVIDEPTAGLNDVESAAIMELLASLSQGRDPRRCVIAITSSEFGDAYDAVDRQIEL